MKQNKKLTKEELADYSLGDKIISNYEMLQIVKKLPPAEIKKCTSFPTLNNEVQGFAPGELIIVSGLPKRGKTLFCRTLTNDFYHQRENVLWFSYEEAPRFFLNNFPMQSEDITFFMPAQMKERNIGWLFERAVEAKIKYECSIMVIDHLHFLFDLSVMRNASLSIGAFVRAIKRFAVDNEYIIFLVCHTTKLRVESEDDLTHMAIRDSSLIAAECDTCLFVHRFLTKEGVVEIERSILKIDITRRSGVMNVVIPTIKEGFYLKETTNKYE